MIDRFDAIQSGLARKQHEALEGVIRLAASHDIAFGEYFSAGEIASELGISRTPVREALSALAFSGVVEVNAQVGTKLIEPDKEELEQMASMNVHAERNAAWSVKLSGGLQTAPSIGLAFDAVAEIGGAEQPDTDLFLKADAAFHRMLCIAGGETAAAQLMRIWGLKRRLYQAAQSSLSEEGIRTLAMADRAIITDIKKEMPGVGQSAVDSYYHHLRRVE